MIEDYETQEVAQKTLRTSSTVCRELPIPIDEWINRPGRLFASLLKDAWGERSRNIDFLEVELFRALMASFAALQDRFQIEELHGTKHQVLFNGEGEWGRQLAQCELSDLLIISYTGDFSLARATFLQAKRSANKHQNLSCVCRADAASTQFQANLEQWDLLARRPDILPHHPFKCDSKILADALLPSIGSFGIFHKTPDGRFDLFYLSADIAEPVGTPKKKHAKLQIPDVACFRENRGNKERAYACNLFTFGEALFNMEVGTPVGFDCAKSQESGYRRKFRTWLYNILRVHSSEKETRLASELTRVLSREFEGSRHEIPLFDFEPPTILLLRTDSPDDEIGDIARNDCSRYCPLIEPTTQMKLLPVHAGVFSMALLSEARGQYSNEHQCKLTLSHDFWMGQYPVTQEEYEEVMGTNPSRQHGASHPVERVSWDDATHFCGELTVKARLSGHLMEGYEYRLPTEAEWEYCCRAGSEAMSCSDDNDPSISDYTCYQGNFGRIEQSVGSLDPNLWGFHDMRGSVWEWCQDWQGPQIADSQTDPIGPVSGLQRVLRNGSSEGPCSHCKTAGRPDIQRDAQGFRVCLAPILDKLNKSAAPKPRICLELVPISPGKFLTGVRGSIYFPPRQVSLTHDFWMGKFPVMQEEYTEIMGTNPSYIRGVRHPVESVTWNDATKFCRQLTNYSRETGHLPEGYEYRLPTSAEWEYCCRAGSETNYSFGDNVETMGDYAWHCANSGDRTHPVGQKKPNGWGLYDMHGNVWEWCHDRCSGSGRYSTVVQTNPSGSVSGVYRVARGDSCAKSEEVYYACYECAAKPDSHYRDLGFRVCLARPLK